MNESIVVNSDDQRKLYRWAVMATIVAEFINKGNISIPETDRNYFYLNQNPPQCWKIWIAKNEGSKWQKQVYNSRKIKLPDKISDFGKGIIPTISNSHLAIFGIGSILIITSRVPWPEYDFNFLGDFAKNIFQIYPHRLECVDWDKAKAMNDSEINFLFDYYKFSVTNGQVF